MPPYIGGFDHYLAVRDGCRHARHVLARSITAVSADTPSTEHANALAELRRLEAMGAGVPASDTEISLLDLKIKLADRALDACDLCPHYCLVNRTDGQHGFCGVSTQAAVHWEGILHGEEAEVLPSHEVFLSGCTMRCAFCYSHEHITRPMSGTAWTPLQLATCIDDRRAQGSTNVNMVGGEPTVHIAHILRTLKQTKSKMPVIWNSNMYATRTALNLLDGIVDLYLGDIHFGNDDCARKLGKIPDYIASLTYSFGAAIASGAGVIIRHLVVPGHLECCTRPALRWAADNFPETPLHLMFQYTPDYHAVGDAVLGRILSQAEIGMAKKMAEEIGVRLYQKPADTVATESQAACLTGVGDSVDILIHADGRVGFTRLLGNLIPVAQALMETKKDLAGTIGGTHDG